MDVYRETGEKDSKQYEIFFPILLWNHTKPITMNYLLYSSLQFGFPNTDRGGFLHVRVEQHERVERAGEQR